jgi:hypothetical protein
MTKHRKLQMIKNFKRSKMPFLQAQVCIVGRYCLHAKIVSSEDNQLFGRNISRNSVNEIEWPLLRIIIRQ